MMTDYIFEGQQDDQELLRLRMIEEALDRSTITQLERSGLRSNWRCLELGAGAGSIMKWMGDVVGAGGSVVGVDRNTRHLRDLSDPRFQIVEADFLEATFEDPFDLAHCRYVLIHNRTSKEILTKLWKQLKPGGFLVVEEPDFTSAKLLNGSDPCAQQNVNNAICRMFENMELNPRYGLDLPGKVADQGMRIIATDVRLHLDRGNSPMARMMAVSQGTLADQYVATGEATESDIEQYIQNTCDPQFWAVYYCTVSVVAQKPA